MVSRSTAVAAAACSETVKSVGTPRATNRGEQRAAHPEVLLICVPQGRRSALGVPATKSPCTSVPGRCGSCSGLLYVVVFSARRTACFTALQARGRSRGRLPRAFDEHLEDASYSFHGFLLARASGLRH